MGAIRQEHACRFITQGDLERRRGSTSSPIREFRRPESLCLDCHCVNLFSTTRITLSPASTVHLRLSSLFEFVGFPFLEESKRKW